MLRADELWTEELKSLVLKMASLGEVLGAFGPREEIPLLDESGISIGVVAGAEVLSLLGSEVSVPESLL